jgi:hypothetical protein
MADGRCIAGSRSVMLIPRVLRLLMDCRSHAAAIVALSRIIGSKDDQEDWISFVPDM